MTTREEALAFGLSYPDTCQDAPFHDPNWQLVRIKSSKKVFLWTYEKDGYINLNVKADPEWRDYWRSAFASVTAGYHLNKEHWSTIILDGTVPDDAIKNMIDESYRMVTDSPTKRIYEAVKKIPKGKVATYGQVAQMAGNPRMARAVGNALHKNPDELMEQAKLEEGDILVVGCSSSEIASHRIGSYSSAEIGEAVAQTFLNCCKEKKIYLAAQCCEHLNRAIIIEKTAAKEYRLPMVNVVPKLKAGGSFATAVYAALQAPVAVEAIQAHAGIDIGDTLIGMHLRPVAVPVRISTKHIGEAHVVCARTRLKFIGGERASYLENEK